MIPISSTAYYPMHVKPLDAHTAATANGYANDGTRSKPTSPPIFSILGEKLVEVSDVSKLTKALEGFPCDLEIGECSITIKVKLIRPITDYPEICKGLIEALEGEIEGDVDDHEHVFAPHFTTDVCEICGRTPSEIGEIRKQNDLIKNIIKKLSEGWKDEK